VLNELMARLQSRRVSYWRDKRGHEVDFVLAASRQSPLALECKWSADSFHPANVQAFRRQHPEGENVVVAHDVERAFSRSFAGVKIRFEGLESFAASVAAR
jgi:uncharacterized protein